ncbi:MAG TPA: hypothetical protein PL048_23335, partial [Leptospiraceae bacterium]|nr:hypothetical protein [Leptospiraceae bacterium]HMZ61727.1 hypothetical protein [Leptospiraceae bacterium]HNF14492.1 hypothetical protein [Leptospiraceae bacterium]HNF24366.1 hypothetical protein [Leptospiraceae bacterium]HNI95278.1 hypothetical protein [Leptospiraceae bacterium]
YLKLLSICSFTTMFGTLPPKIFIAAAKIFEIIVERGLNDFNNRCFRINRFVFTGTFEKFW